MQHSSIGKDDRDGEMITSPLASERQLNGLVESIEKSHPSISAAPITETGVDFFVV